MGHKVVHYCKYRKVKGGDTGEGIQACPTDSFYTHTHNTLDSPLAITQSSTPGDDGNHRHHNRRRRDINLNQEIVVH
ncbi:hypothetical protein L1987_84663 [Smallanthus sonchifolius]|uniref:Uncharacterized protein n=1 Tax=Smallanthus sonchifolius TaxID=185202 RepID=A0ACB8XVZ9_9ASTR|nr:hypothetical protein L1987_84663 [Smallanthus sonchifolius]